MTTLNKALRQKIIDSVIKNGTTIPKRKEELKKKTAARVRELDLERVPKEFIEATKNMPAEWFPHAASNQMPPSVCPDSYVELTDEQMRNCWRAVVSYEAFRHPMNARFDRPDHATQTKFIGGESVTTEYPDSWEARMKDLLDEAKKIRADEQQARDELRQFLQSVSTYKQVIEKMPELEKHLPDYIKPLPLTVPVGPILKTLGKLGFDQSKDDAKAA